MKSVTFFVICAASVAFAGEPSVEAAQPSLASNQLQLMGLLAGLSVVPFAIMMLTSFSKVVVVLSIVRSAIGTQQAPPTMVLTGLAAVLSAHIMTPTMEAMVASAKGVDFGSASGSQVLSMASNVAQPLRDFLVKHGSAEERARFVDLARELRPVEQADQVSENDLSVVVPAFVISELKEAFIIGFLIFLPFLVLDMLVANILLALGMQTLSPGQVALPFKILLFVAVDGWALLARGLILGYR
jgi:type III secretion protein R